VLPSNQVTTLPPPNAQTGQPYEGLDVVFLIDQSGSMGGAKYGSQPHPNANDPDDRRFEVSRFAINFIGELRYRYAKLSNQDWDARASVIYFGSSANPAEAVERPLESQLIAPESEEQWKNTWNSIEPRLSPSAFGQRNLGNTDFLSAFKEAINQFKIMDAQHSGNRLRAIIMVTDGAPCVTSPTIPTTCLGGEQQIRDVQAYVAQNYNGPNDRLYMVALNDADPYWTGGPGIPAYGPYWEQMAANRGRARLVANNETEVTAYVQEAINELVAPFICRNEGDIGCVVRVKDRVVVSPYLSSIEFIVHKLRPDDQVSFVKETNPIDLSAAQRAGTDTLVETILVRNPVPGIWSVVYPQGREVTIFKTDVLQPIFKLDIGSDSSKLGCGRPSTLRLQFLGQDGAPVTELPEYPIQISIEIGWNEGPQQQDMGRPIQAGMYEQRVVLTGGGQDVPVKLRATTKDPEGKDVILYNGDVVKVSAPVCKYDWADPLPTRVEQFTVFTPTVVLLDGTTRLPLEGPNEYQISASFNISTTASGVVQQQPIGTLSPDGLSIAAPVHVTSDKDLVLNVAMSMKDLKTGQEQIIHTFSAQHIGVDPRFLVRMAVKPIHPLQIEACDLAGNRTVLGWQMYFVDDKGNQLDPKDVLAHPDSLPFSITLLNTDTKKPVTSPVRQSQSPLQLPPAGTSDYQWTVANMSPGEYQAQIEFTGDVNSTYIKDAGATRYLGTITLRSPDNLELWRVGSSLGSALAVALLVGLIFLFFIRPRLGPVPQESLVLTRENLASAGFGVLGRTTMSLKPDTRQAITTRDYAQLGDYSDELQVRQDPNNWDYVHITPIIEDQQKRGFRPRPIRLQMGGTVDLQNKTAGQPGALLEYKVRDLNEAEENWKNKQKRDRRTRTIGLVLGGILAIGAAAAIWMFLPLGCA
jgi:hypothetical protein